MKVLVTGASGFIGGHMTEALQDAGHTVRGLARTMPQGKRRREGTEYVGGVDVADRTTLTPEMFAGIEAIVHLVGIIQEAKGGQSFQRIHVQGTKNVIEAAKQAGFSGRFVYMSAIGSDSNAPAEYSRTKAAAEELVKASEFAYTIFRPSIVIGRDGEFVAQMQDLIKHGGLPFKFPFPVIPVPGSGSNKFQPIDVEQLCAAVVKSLSDPATAGQTYEVGGASQVTFNALLQGFADKLNVKKPLLHAPVPLLKIAATVMEKVLPKPPVTRDQLANLGRDNVTSSTALADVFEIAPLDFPQILAKIYGK